MIKKKNDKIEEIKEEPNIKESAFNLFNDDKPEPNKPNLFDKVEMDQRPLDENNTQKEIQKENQNKMNLDFLNDLKENEVQKSTLFFNEDNTQQNNNKPVFGENEGENSNNKNTNNDNIKKEEPNKKKLAFLYDDDD